MMKLKGLVSLFGLILFVSFSYSAANAQIVDAVKDAAEKTKDVTVDAAKKTADVTGDIAEGAKDVTVDGVKAAGKGAKKVGNYTVDVTENVAGQAYEGGRWLTVTTWDGTKWVSKKVWFASKKAASATKDAVVGDDDEKKP